MLNNPCYFLSSCISGCLLPVVPLRVSSDSRAVADSCSPGWVQASCCFISPRVLWHLSLFTCSVTMIPSDRVSNRSSVAVLSFPLFLLAILNLPPVISFCLPFFRSWTVQVQSELIVHWDRQRRKRCQSAGDRGKPELGKNVHHRTAPLWSPLPLAFI